MRAIEADNEQLKGALPKVFGGTAADRIEILPAAANHVLHQARAGGQEDHKDFGKRFLDAIAALAKAFKLAAGSSEAKDHAEEVAFFLAVRSALQKLDVKGGGGAERLTGLRDRATAEPGRRLD